MNIEEVLLDLNVEHLRNGHHHCRPGWVQLRDCPFCGSANYHLGFNTSLGFFSCWRCGGHKTYDTLLALGADKMTARNLARGITTEEPQKRERSRISVQVPAGLGDLEGAHRVYLRSRGFVPEEVVKLWKIRAIGLAPRLSWRIFIPIFYNEEMVSWTTRGIGEATQRYISASAEQEKLNHKHLVYGQGYCQHSIIIVEGPIDAWRVGPGAGALFGTSFTTAQVKKLIQHPYRYVVFDSSKEAQEKGEELASQLSAFPGHTENIQLDAKDPGSAGKREIKRLRKAARLE